MPGRRLQAGIGEQDLPPCFAAGVEEQQSAAITCTPEAVCAADLDIHLAAIELGLELLTDPALEGSCIVTTTRVLAAALRTIETSSWGVIRVW